MAKCRKCGRSGLFRAIDKETGLCNQCAQLLVRKMHPRVTAETKNRNSFDEFDEFDRLEAEAILRDQQERAARQKSIEDYSFQTGKNGDKQRMKNLEAYGLPSIDEKPFDAGFTSRNKSLQLKQVKTTESEEYDLQEYVFPPITLLKESSEGKVNLREIIESNEFKNYPSKTLVGIGKNSAGKIVVADIAQMPHLLIGGQTGSGKSVCISAIIMSVLFRASPYEVKLILIDPKAAELSIFNSIPHLVCHVITDPKAASNALDWVVEQMNARYKEFTKQGVRNIDSYNKLSNKGIKALPRLLIIIDDFSELMMIAPQIIESCVCRIAQMGNNAGIHLIISTNHASSKVITSAIRENIPARISFSTVSKIESRMLLNEAGAEKLYEKGEMLFKSFGYNHPLHVKGVWVSDEEVSAVVDAIKQSKKAAFFDATVMYFNEEYDPKLPEAVDIALDLGQVSISMLQRKMRIGYARAGRIIDEMTRRGIVSEAEGSKPREILISREDAQQMFEE